MLSPELRLKTEHKIINSRFMIKWVLTRLCMARTKLQVVAPILVETLRSWLVGGCFFSENKHGNLAFSICR